MPLIVVRFGGQIEEMDGGAKVFGEANIDGANLTDADAERYKDAVISAAQLAWSGGDYTPAQVNADFAPFGEAIANMMMMTLAGDMATCKVVAITVAGGAEPAEPTDNVTLNDTVDIGDGKTAKVVGAILVGGASDLALAKQSALQAVAPATAGGTTFAFQDILVVGHHHATRRIAS